MLIAVIAVLVYMQKSHTPHPLWRHIPANIDQVMITNYSLATSLPQQVRGVQQTILAQDNDAGVSLLFVQADDTFSTQEFLSAFASGGQVQYSFQDMGDDLYVYAAPAVLDAYKTMTGEFFAIPNIKKTMAKMPSMQHITISRVDPERAQIPDPQIAAFAQNIAYMIVGFGSHKEIEAYLVYTTTQKTIASHLAVSQRDRYFSDTTLLGLVLDNVFGQANYTSGDVLESMQYYLSSYGLNQDDLNTIVETLSSSIGIFVSTDAEFQIGGQVILPNTKIYPVINTLISKAQSTIAGMFGLLPEQLSYTTGATSYTYTLKPIGVSPVTLRVSKNESTTTITLNNPTT